MLLLILFYIPDFMNVFLAACFVLRVSCSYERQMKNRLARVAVMLCLSGTAL